MAEEDLIFGKKLHLYGGIEPSNMLAFSAAAIEGAKVRLTLTLPNDTVLNNQTLCSVGGAVVRRSTENYPENEFDGDEVVDITASGTFIDSTAMVDGTYYYSAFPYSTQGVYNRSPVNRFAYNEPAPMAAFTTSLTFNEAAAQNYVNITATLPSGVAGAIIRRGTTGYPANENEGTEIRNLKISSTITDTNVTPGQTYYYSAFPYTSTGNVNRSTANRTSIVVTKADPPGNMKSFTATCTAVGNIKITGTLPDNTENCKVVGYVIRRKVGSYPVNETDGSLVWTLQNDSGMGGKSISVNDTGVETSNGTIYYYAAFPYSNLGIYNRTNASANQAACKSLAYQAPGDMAIFTTTSEKGVIKIHLKLPPDIYIGSVCVCKVKGAFLRRSTTGYPKDRYDGLMSYDIDVDRDGVIEKIYEDRYNIVSNQHYYYRAFLYSDQTKYNMNNVEANRSMAIGRTADYIFGYDLNMADSNPATRVSYPSDVDNWNYSKIIPNSADGWGSIAAGEKLMPRPCSLSYSGTVNYYLMPDNYTVDTDIGKSRDISGVMLARNIMMEWPKIYTKRWIENGVYHFRCSDIKIDSDYECWCNYNKDNQEIDHFYTGVYPSMLYDGRARSLSSAKVSDCGNFPADKMAAAKANGEGWYPLLFSDWLLINDLLVMVYKTTNLQNVVGPGINNTGLTESTYTPPKTGLMNNKGLFYGDSTSQTSSSGIKVFGMENWWGYMGQMLCGLLHTGTDTSPARKLLYKITPGNKDGSNATDFNLTGDGYIWLDSLGLFKGFTKDCYTDSSIIKFGRLSFSGNGSSSTYESDYITQYENDAGSTAAFGVGTNGLLSIDDAYLGPFALHFMRTMTFTESRSTVRLCYHG